MIRLARPPKPLQGTIQLEGSKSLSNRLLLLRAYAGVSMKLTGLSPSNDTRTLEQLIAQNQLETLDAGEGGATFRFILPWLAFQNRACVLTGSERMQQRPVGPLVDALLQLGASIRYLGKPGYPPLAIEPGQKPLHARVNISAGISSQFISALLLLAPTLPQGLEIELEGKIVSKPYIDMTIALMQSFGASVSWKGNTIRAAASGYILPEQYELEPDWSAASYFYAAAALAPEADLFLPGLREDSLQGDARIAQIMEPLGVQTYFEKGGARLTKTGTPPVPVLEWDFLDTPDLFQTVAAVCAALGVKGLFTGLDTLPDKETDRIAAMKAELEKAGVFLIKLPPSMAKRQVKTHYLLEGKYDPQRLPQFATYGDHRMAMALAPLAQSGPIGIENPEVVAKSYPGFWDAWKEIGFLDIG